jgi:hypothetical protein
MTASNKALYGAVTTASSCPVLCRASTLFFAASKDMKAGTSPAMLQFRYVGAILVQN